MAFNRIVILLFASISLLIYEVGYAQANLDAQESIRREQRLQQLEELLQPERDVFLPTKITEATIDGRLPEEAVCFPIDSIQLKGAGHERFSSTVTEVLNEVGFTKGQCLGGLGINQIMVRLQNEIIHKGYTTSRILVGPQDLKSRQLILTLLLGKIVKTELNEEASAYERVLLNAFPYSRNNVLNLHEIEQGLENLKRVPSSEATIEILPTEKIDESILHIHYEPSSFPYRFSLTLDDSGSKTTGKYQATASFSADNPLGLNDLFFASYSHDLGRTHKVNNESGRTGSNDGYALHYSIPLGNWQIAANYNRSHYHQTVPGFNENYRYSGRNNNFELGVKRLLYRDAKRKTTAGLAYWARSSRNFIEDVEVDVQRRKMAGWKAHINHREYIQNKVLDLTLGYKWGTGVNNSKRAPEETFNEGTSRPKIITASLNFFTPFQLGETQWSYNGYLHWQRNLRPLVPQDRLAIGSRYTVRGFDEENTLMADRGWYMQNTFALHYKENHQFYLGVDAGHISGPSAKYNVGHTLIGGAVGFKGQFSQYGHLYYDFFAGTPIRKPKYFRTSRKNLNFSLTYSF